MKTLQINADLHKNLKSLAHHRETSLSKLTHKILSQYTDIHRPDYSKNPNIEIMKYDLEILMAELFKIHSDNFDLDKLDISMKSFHQLATDYQKAYCINLPDEEDAHHLDPILFLQQNLDDLFNDDYYGYPYSEKTFQLSNAYIQYNPIED